MHFNGEPTFFLTPIDKNPQIKNCRAGLASEAYARKTIARLVHHRISGEYYVEPLFNWWHDWLAQAIERKRIMKENKERKRMRPLFASKSERNRNEARTHHGAAASQHDQ